MQEWTTATPPQTTPTWSPDWIGAPTPPLDLARIETLANRYRLGIRGMGDHHWIAATEESFRHHGYPMWFGDRIKHLCARYPGAELVLGQFRRISRMGAIPVGPDSPYAAPFDEALASRLPDSAAELRARREELAAVLVELDDQLLYVVNGYIDVVGALLLLDPPGFYETRADHPHPLQSHLQVWRQMGLGNSDPFGDELRPYLDKITDPVARRALDKGIRVAHHRLRVHHESCEVPRKVGLYLAIDRKLDAVTGAEPPVPAMSDLAGKDVEPFDRELLAALDSPAELEKIVYRAGDTWEDRFQRLAELCRRTGRSCRYSNAMSLKSAMSRAGGKKKRQ